jgi:hypothetical protein
VIDATAPLGDSAERREGMRCYLPEMEAIQEHGISVLCGIFEI